MNRRNGKFNWLLPVAAAGLLLAVTVWSRPAAAIVGGVLDETGHPNVGATVWVNPPADRDFDVPRVQCSGTLIHPRVFLTAGHCTFNIERRLNEGLMTLDDMRVSFGSDAFDPKTWHEISGVITHPDYDDNQNNGNGAPPLSDVGVIILKRPVRNINPAALAPEGFLDFLDETGELQAHPDGTPFVVVGFGRTRVPHTDPNPPPDGLRRVAVSEFMDLIGEWLYLSQNFSQGEGGTSFGDSGGPTFWVDPDTGEEILVGVTSRGDLAVVSVGVADRTDTPRTLDFLDSVIELVEAGAL